MSPADVARRLSRAEVGRAPGEHRRYFSVAFVCFTIT